MQYPQITEYVRAITDAGDNFDKLSYLRPVKDNNGEPLRSVGGFAVVFKMQDEDTGKIYAIKCFHEDQEGRNQAYKEISETLRKERSPYLIEVNYLEKELFVDTSMSDETEYPVLQMDWVDGETMESFISSHYRDNIAIKKLYEKFCDMALWLRTKEFAHGDIKPDNIMIKSDGSLVLVDYDGMFVPSLTGKTSPTIGTKDFSHPLRTDKDFNKDIDDFALASMSISLLAMSEDPNLYKDCGAPDRLLLSYEDYKDFPNSSIYKRLLNLGGIFPRLLDLFTECLRTSVSNTSLYDKIFDIQTKAPEIISFSSIKGNVVYEGDEIILTWKTENTTQTFINDIDVSGKVNYKCKANLSKDFEFKATNGLKESKKSISVEVLPKPTISFKSSSLKLKRGKEDKVHLNWNVKNSTSVLLVIGKEEKYVNPDGNIEVELQESSEVNLIVIGLDEKRSFNKVLRINFFSESEIVFSADKYYSLPNIPIKLSWDVSHAKNVELVGIGKVDLLGSLVVSPSETTIYTIKVTDAFGVKEESLKIQMLPLPYVKSLNVPTPMFNNAMDVKISVPTPDLRTKFPDIRLMGIDLKAPFVSSLSELKLDVKLTKRIEKQIKFWADVKSVYLYYKNKILEK